MRAEHMLVGEDTQMTVYRANVKIKINGSVTSTWVEIEAANANTARGLLQAQYGRDNIINVIRKSGQ